MRIVKIKLYENSAPVEFNAKALELKPEDRVLALKDDTIYRGTVAEDVKVEERGAGTLPEILRKLYNFETGEKFLHYMVENDGIDFCRTQVKKLGILMKLLKVRFLSQENKLIFFYSADERVDFRELVKILAGRFHMRIEMRQINIRDECKLLGGLGVCGRECCCGSFIHELARVQIKTARAQCQGAAKLAGYCGRLLCCLAFDPYGEEGGICKPDNNKGPVFYSSYASGEEGSGDENQ